MPSNPADRYGARSNGHTKDQFSDTVKLTNDRPPTYFSEHHGHESSRFSAAAPTYTSGFYGKEDGSLSRRNPKNWSRRCWLILAAVLIVVLILIIIIAVVVSRANRYPNYSTLNYNLVDTYAGTSFFDNFNYFTGYDPAQGFVHYVDGLGSIALNLTYASATSAVLRVDLSDTDTTTGRKSVRIESKNTYNNGLFIFDILHTPYGCSTWPALWLSDQSNWPTNGEIDVIESTNTATVGNQMTLHTTEGCSMSVKRKETGSVLTTNCYNGTDGNAGCGVQGQPATFGEAFNNNGGGVYAMEFRDAGIRTWFFPRSNIPSDITTSTSNSTSGGSSSVGGTPDPSTWGEALADFPSTDCDIGSHFRNQSIIANIDLCGQWAGLEQYYSQQAGCPGTCVEYVSQQPGSAYENAYWEFASFRVYQAA